MFGHFDIKIYFAGKIMQGRMFRESLWTKFSNYLMTQSSAIANWFKKGWHFVNEKDADSCIIPFSLQTAHKNMFMQVPQKNLFV